MDDRNKLIDQLNRRIDFMTETQRKKDARINDLEVALLDVRHFVLNEVTFATHPQSIVLSAITKRIGEALERK